MANRTLVREQDPLADPAQQRSLLKKTKRHRSFQKALRESDLWPLRAVGIEVLQLNLGKLCNMTCVHCHVDAGPDRREIMSRETAEACLNVLRRTDIPTLDLTGGAPEMNPHFRWIVQEARQAGRHVIDRCNLTILQVPGYRDLPEFLAEHGVEIVASLPCYLEENVDAQRGDRAFQRSLQALRRLNALGYGRPDSPLELTLVYNPLGPSLPPNQQELEAIYRRELSARYQIQFTRLIVMTNMPISRFLKHLLKTGQYDQYMQMLIDAYNPAAAAGAMCRTTLSVDWRGYLYDCDFNQMLGLTLQDGLPRHIAQFDFAALARRPIRTGQHCFGCAAGAGSGCRGAIVRSE